MKTRLLGAAVLIALAVLFVPMFFSSTPPPGGDQSVTLAIPPAPDRDLQTRTMDLGTDHPAGNSSTPAIPTQMAAPSDQLATVDIGSRRPRDVGTAPTSGAPEQSAAPPTAPPAAAPAAASPPETATKQPDDSKPASAQTAGATVTAAHQRFTLNLSAYANHASAQRLIGKVRALGYPVSGSSLKQEGKSLTLVTAGPFATRAAAEAARLKITQSISGVPARLESQAEDQHGDAAATPAPARTHAATPSRAGGFAVQVAAMAGQADANALRDKLRGAGFDGFVDSVQVGGRRLWRVRAGPMTQRDEALRVRDRIKSQLALDGNVVSVP